MEERVRGREGRVGRITLWATDGLERASEREGEGGEGEERVNKTKGGIDDRGRAVSE